MAEREWENSAVELPSQILRGIRLVSSNLRSANLVRDSAAPAMGPLHVNARILDALSRLASALDDCGRPRAWSLTGPYGSGKSTLAVLITALLGPESNRRREAESLIAAASPVLAHRITAARDRIAPEGFIMALAAARRESITETLQRALTRGAQGCWPDGKYPNRIRASLKALRAPHAGSTEALAALEAMCDVAPTLLVIDEFGKILEHLANERSIGSASNDVYLLQEIAEAGAGQSGLPLYTMTLQHLAFLDYSAHSTALQRREWAKVQGRFEDIIFTPDASDAVHFITHSIDQSGVGESGKDFIQRHGAESAAAWTRLGLQGVLPADGELFAALYPLHPLTAAVAPLVAAQIGQHDRSLTGFLTNDEPSTVRRFIGEEGANEEPAALTVGLPQLYDYFFASGRTTIMASATASRWIEIDLIIAEAHGLDEQDLRILKTVGILNLVDAAGALRACPGTVLFALADPTSDNAHVREELISRIDSLTQRGFIVYREFSDEYRIWRGSVVDLQARIGEVRARCDDHAVAKMLEGHIPPAVIAGRHSQRTGMLRHFVTTATDPGSDAVTGPHVGGSADGMMIFHYGEEHDLPDIRSQLPVVVGITKNVAAVLDAGREVMALEELLSADGLDVTARREVTERAGQARAELATVLADAFNPGKPWARWLLVNSPDGDVEDGEIGQGPTVLSGQSLARVVSDACDIFYPHTPHIRNEMLGRHQLTSQGAKARRELITAMLVEPFSPFLGITGYGPERAIYDGVLVFLRLHGQVRQSGVAETSVEYGFTEPGSESTLTPAWMALCEKLAREAREIQIDELFRFLMAPPYGVKAGVVPVIIVAALILGRDEIAVFEEGTYQPTLTPDLIERLIKAPGRYSAKYAPTATGQRELALEEIGKALGIARGSRSSQSRNPELLAITRELLNRVRSLTAYSANTKRLSQRALSVRNALKAARDPDELLFTTLPHVLALPVIPVAAERDQGQATEFASRLSGALREINGADQALREDVTRILTQEFRLPEGISAMRQSLAARTAVFADSISETELRGFISLALNEDLADDEWLDPVAVRLVHAGLASWSDGHLKQFENAARRLSRALDRLIHLYEPGVDVAEAPGMQAQLVSITSPDGVERRVLVHIPDSVTGAASRLAAEVAMTADNQLGADGRRILLAMLAQALAAPDAADQSPL